MKLDLELIKKSLMQQIGLHHRDVKLKNSFSEVAEQH